MSIFFIVVDQLQDWSPYYPSQDVITFEDYLRRVPKEEGSRVRVINLSRKYKYLSTGYYCSLLAEARGHHVLPSVKTLSEVELKQLEILQLDAVAKGLSKLEPAAEGSELDFRCWFGQCLQAEYLPIAAEVFRRIPCPLLEITLQFKKKWQIKGIKLASLPTLKTSEEQEAFANAFSGFCSKLWRQPKARKAYRYDLAILIDPQEKMPPSDPKALKNFVKAANHLGIAADFITKKDYLRLPEYDGLFIRESTLVTNHTYRFAKKAEAEDMVVIDDPTSIMRCTNKIYLADLLQTHKIPTPHTEIFSSASDAQLQKLVDIIGFPMVLKIPDGSFSRGVVKVDDWAALQRESKQQLQNSSLLLAQPFVYTQYDWRVGLFNHKPLYACRYYMVKDHWQIYQHVGQQVKAGKYETLPTFEIPRAVLNAATRAAKLIGDGFYGVDLKQSDDHTVVVIEVNDNPSIDSDVEDLYLKDQLYIEIMQEFLRRMEKRRQ